MRKTAHDAVYKTIDGANRNIAVVVQHVAQYIVGQFAQGGLRLFVVLAQLRGKVVILGRAGAYALQRLNDAALHFVRRLVGKGNGEYVPVLARTGKGQAQILLYQRVRFAATGTCFIYV